MINFNVLAESNVVSIGFVGLPWILLLILVVFVGVIIFETYYLLMKFPAKAEDNQEKLLLLKKGSKC